jgi:transposase-like protein
MSLKSLPIPPIPEEVVRIARAVFPRGNVFMQVRDTLGTIYTDEAFADLFPTHGQPAFAPWRLALVTIFQFMEGLTDRQAADAVRDRLAWKYALSLELTDTNYPSKYEMEEYGMVTLTVRCPSCQSDQLVRNGHAPNGKQKYRCCACKRQSREEPTPNVYSEARREEILRAYEERSSLRGLTRTFGVSRTTVTAWSSLTPPTLKPQR